MDFEYHGALKVIERGPEWSPQLPFDLKLAFELTNLDISIVNGLRRMVFSGVPCVTISPDIGLKLDDNVTVFNTQYLKDRLSLQPIHLNSKEDLEKYRNQAEGSLLFKIADSENWDQPLRNEANRDRYVTAADIIVLEKIGKAVSKSELPPKKPKIPKATNKQSETANELKEENAREGDEAFLAQAEALEDLQAGEEAGQAIDGIGTEPGAEEKAPDFDETELSRSYRRLDSKDFFTYQEMYLAVLKKGESLYVEMKPQVGTGEEHARWTSGLITYRFKPRNPEILDNPENWSKDYHPIRERQEYPRAESLSGQYGSPKTFEIGIEYNGHYPPSLVWVLAIEQLHQKFVDFQSQLRLITEARNGRVSDTLYVEFNRADISNLITLTIENEDHTLGNIIFSHCLYFLENFVLAVAGKERYADEIASCLSHYRIPHPLENKLVIEVRTPNWSQSDLEKGFASQLQKGENPYDDALYQHIPSMRVLMITIERVINLLEGVSTEAQGIHQLSLQKKIPTQLIEARLPQAPLVESVQTATIKEYYADILKEEEEIVGEKEEAEEVEEKER